MAQWFETKVRYERLEENGVVRKVTQPYLVDAVSFAEAEARITEEMRPFISGDFTVSAAKREKICEVISEGCGDRWYRVRAMFINIDEKSGIEKKTAHDFMVLASTLKEAIENFESSVHLLIDYELAGITETPIIDVYPRETINNIHKPLKRH